MELMINFPYLPPKNVSFLNKTVNFKWDSVPLGIFKSILENMEGLRSVEEATEMVEFWDT